MTDTMAGSTGGGAATRSAGSTGGVVAATGRVVLTVAALTLREAARRRVLRALAVLTLVLLGLSAWGFAKLGGFEAEFGELTSGEARLVASQLLNLVMFGLSMIAALGTAFLAGPTLAGEIESGMALAVLARPVPRFAVLLGKWLGLVAFGTGFIAVAGLAQFVIVQVTVGYWPPQPVLGLALLAAQTTVLLTLGLLLSTVISPMASGIVAVGLFGAAWIAGVVGGVGAALGNEGVARVGTISQVLLPTDGLWRGAVWSLEPASLIAASRAAGAAAAANPFFAADPPPSAYVVWCVIWIVLMLALGVWSFARKEL